MLALLLWICHGVLLWGAWGQFRPRVALLHGLGVAVLTGGLIALGLPIGAIAGAGILLGAVGAWGHPLAPGLFVGLAPLWLLFLVGSGAAVTTCVMAAESAAVVVALVKRYL